MRDPLPRDILLLICEDLAAISDAQTLLHCALSCKDFAVPALMWLYRMGNFTMSTGSSNETDDTIENTKASARQWKSIILSSVGKTAFPYCLYMRSLDLRDLKFLLEDTKFRVNAQEDFFSDDMAQFYQEIASPRKTRNGKLQPSRLDIPKILDSVVESITKHVSDVATQTDSTAGIEELSGDLGASLPVWLARLSRLKSITIWDGSRLTKAAAESIQLNCPNFESISMFFCMGNGADEGLASFLEELRANTLKSFEILSHNTLEAQTLLGLSNHSSSLKELKLACLINRAVTSLNLLRACTSLETISIQKGMAHQMTNSTSWDEETKHEVILWLKSCKRLKEINFSYLDAAPEILTDICLDNDIHLKSLHLLNYVLKDTSDFNKALAHQTSLETLELRADPDGVFGDDLDSLTDAICQLKNLKYLNLLETSEFFNSAKIKTIASNLPLLEDFTIGGYECTDSIWPDIAKLHHLRSLSFHALTSFTFDGIMSYIRNLGPTNKGLYLSVMSATAESHLTPQEIQTISKAIADKVDGTFTFVLFREPREEEFSNSDDD